MTALQKLLTQDPLSKFLFDDLSATILHASPVQFLRQASRDLETTAAEVYETEKNYFLQIDLPGIPRDEISVEVEGGYLVVKGERKLEAPEEGAKKIFSTRLQRKFHEAFALPENADQEKITGNHKDGVLYVAIEKRKKPEPVKIRLQGDA